MDFTGKRLVSIERLALKDQLAGVVDLLGGKPIFPAKLSFLGAALVRVRSEIRLWLTAFKSRFL